MAEKSGGDLCGGQRGGVPAVGELVAEKYRVEHVLGRGGMGVVVAATHVALGRRVALKFLAPEAVHDERLLARFRREARAAARLQSEHAVRLLDVASLPSGEPFLVMECLEGADLASVLETEGPLPPWRAASYLREACEALAEAHGLGIVHRDLKPSNLFLCRRLDGRRSLKVLDFGISKLGPGTAVAEFATGDATLTGPAAQLGSPLYMSPEQLRAAHDVDARSDVWQLGVCLYELVTGRLPFEGTTLPMVYANILLGSPAPLFGPAGDPPAGFEDVVRRCLERDAARRFPDVRALADALAPFASAEATGAWPPLAASAPRRRRSAPTLATSVPPAEAPTLATSVPPAEAAEGAGLALTAGAVATRDVEGAAKGSGPLSRLRRRAGWALGAALALGFMAALPRVRALGSPTSDHSPALNPAVVETLAAALASQAPEGPSTPAAADTPEPPARLSNAAEAPPDVVQALERPALSGTPRWPRAPTRSPRLVLRPPAAAPAESKAEAVERATTPPTGAPPRDRTSGFGDRQ